MSRTTANALLLITGAIWGMGFVAQQSAMDDMSAMLFVALRFATATITVLPLALLELRRGEERLSWRHAKQFSLLGLVFFLAMTLQQLGLLGTTVTNAGFLTAIYVVLVPMIMLGIFRQRQPVVIWVAAAISLLGIYLLSDGDLSKVSRGDWLVVGCACFWAVHVVLVGRFAGQTKLPVTMAATQFLVCALLATIAHLVWVGVVADYADVPAGAFTIEILLAALPEILYAGAISGGLAFTLQIVAQRHTSPSIAAILMGSESLFAAVFAAILLGDRLTGLAYAGCALIFAAVLAVELFPSQRSRVMRVE